jgi:hypothetical protein
LSNFGTPCHVVAINIKSKNLRASISHPNQNCIKKWHQSHAPRICIWFRQLTPSQTTRFCLLPNGNYSDFDSC